MKELTPRQRETLEWIKSFIREHGMPPTVREIGAAFGIKSSSVFDLLKVLERKGYLERGDLGARSLIIKGKGRRRAACHCEEVPIIGRIDAGNLSIAEWMGKDKAIRRLYCKTCGRRFSERQGSFKNWVSAAGSTPLIWNGSTVR